MNNGSPARPVSVRLPAHAKLNISLAVGPLQADGYHLIESLMVPLDLADEVALSPSAGGVQLTVSGPTAGGTPCDATNLAWRAAELIADQAGRAADVAIQLVKRIPVAGGLAGGSADAAAVLVGLNRMWGLNWPLDRLIALAARLGSDVPFCVAGVPAWVRGRGESVQPLAAPLPSLCVLLVLPHMAVSTRDVYARLDAIRAKSPAESTRKRVLTGLEFFNDLERPALAVCPALGKLFEILEQSIGVPRLFVAGSGSTLFAPFQTRAEAMVWKERIEAAIRDGRMALPAPHAKCGAVVASVFGGASTDGRPGPAGRDGQSCSVVQGVSDGRHRSENQAGGPAE